MAKAKKKEPTLEEVVEDIRKDLKDLTMIVSMLAENVPKAPEEETEVIEVPPEEKNEPEKNREAQEEMDVTTRVPSAWRKIIDTELGKDFEAKFEDGGNGNFVLFLTLPKHLDRRKVNVIDGTRDISTGSISRAADVSDVEKLCQLVKSNIQKTHPDFKKEDK